MTTDFEFAVSLNAEEPLAINVISQTLRDVESLLREIERAHRQVHQASAEWKWGESNPLTFVAHVNGVDAATLDRIVGTAQAGFEQASVAARTQGQGEWPPEFGTEARRSAERILSRLAILESITIEATGRAPLVIREAQVGHLVAGRSRRRVFASVGGVLELVAHPPRGRNVRAGLRESHSARYVHCELEADRWRDELRERNLWDRQVTLYGRVAYDDEGVPLSIVDVSDIVDRESGIRLRDFRGAAPALADGLGLDEAINRLRDNG